MIQIVIFIVAVLLGLAGLLALIFLTWKLFHDFRRKHRLLREEDERTRARKLAEDFSLFQDSNIKFNEYIEATHTRKQLSPGATSGKILTDSILGQKLDREKVIRDHKVRRP